MPKEFRFDTDGRRGSAGISIAPGSRLLRLRFLLDSNAVIALLKEALRISARVRDHAPIDFGISSIVAHEVYYGAFRGARVTENSARIGRLRIPVVEFDREDAVEAGRIRAELASAGTPIGPYAVLIAGQAKARGLTLITRKLREFHRVQGLRAQNWEDEAEPMR